MPRRHHQSETRHSTDAEIDARVEMCRKMIANGRYDGEIKRAVAAHFNASTRTVERYLRRARDEILAESGKPVIEHRAESLAFYQKVRADLKEATKDRLRAQERIDGLLALAMPSAPQRHELSGPGGKPMQTQDVPTDEAVMDAEIANLQERLARRGASVVPNVVPNVE